MAVPGGPARLGCVLREEGDPWRARDVTLTIEAVTTCSRLVHDRSSMRPLLTALLIAIALWLVETIAFLLSYVCTSRSTR
jgi:hypothetical protein